MKNHPLIGITTGNRISEEGRRLFVSYAPVSKAVELAGGLPVMLPCDITLETLRMLYERVAGILLPGGGDIDPIRYRAEKHPKTEGIDLPRDEAEITLAQWAAKENRPLFCICRGHQVLNVALGGTLIQDIPSEIPAALEHYGNASRQQRIHEVQIANGSRLTQIMATNAAPVNSFHHQALGQIAPSLRVVAHSPDGIAEATEITNHRFGLSVQWHPEDLTDETMMLRLFEAFVTAARKS